MCLFSRAHHGTAGNFHYPYPLLKARPCAVFFAFASSSGTARLSTVESSEEKGRRGKTPPESTRWSMGRWRSFVCTSHFVCALKNLVRQTRCRPGWPIKRIAPDPSGYFPTPHAVGIRVRPRAREWLTITVQPTAPVASSRQLQ